ncbi:MAG: carboxymuconolactone decarboxylase family protein [Planctomycetes bacterium]|nr:carboxymuconolactone decarboxylase family protein [Planctomycetota bacterium]
MTSERIAALCRVAWAIGRRDSTRLDAALDACAASESRCHVVEAILQGIPYSGFPSAIEALGRWSDRERAGGFAADRPVEVEGSDSERVTRGRQIFEAVYGRLTDRVLSTLRSRHPDLERWILGFAYGRVMGRGHLELADLEALGVASLLGQGLLAPLHSHLRGAHRMGWSKEDLRNLVRLLAADDSAGIRALEIVDDL